MKLFLLLSVSFLFTIHNQAQQTRNVDSLRERLALTKKPLERFDLMNKIAETQFRGSKLRIDSVFCLELLRIAQDEKNDSLLAISYNWLGNYFSWTSDFKNAIEYFLKGVPLAAKSNDKRRLSSLYIDISIIHNSLNNPAEEFHYLKLAANNLPDPSAALFPFMDIQVKTLMAKYYYERLQLDSALYYAQASAQINLQLQSQFFSSMIDALLGAIHEKLGNRDLAQTYFNKSVVLLDSNRHYSSVKFQRINYVNFLLRDNQLAAAKIQALNTFRVAREINNDEMGLAATALIQDIYEKENNRDSAYEYLKIQSVLRDSLFSREKLNRIHSLAFAERLRTREEERKAIAAGEARKRELQFLFISIVILLFVIFFLLISHSIIVKEAFIKFIGILVLLVVFEYINLLIHPYLGEITHHSPLPMLLIMVAIGAMLVPLHHHLEKWITQRLVEKNKQLRLSAAKKTIEKLEKKNPG